MMLIRLIWHVIGLAVAAGISYGVYFAWGQFPAWAKGTDFNDLRVVAVLLIFVIALSLAEAIWSRLPSRPKDGIAGGR